MDQNSQKKESLELYRSLFRGRTDVYAYRWQNGDGRSGYSPARKHKDGPYLPLTDPAVINHLAGKTTIGLYPLLQDNTTWFFSVDFDGKHGAPLEDARKVVGYCADWAIPAYLERSRSGAGAHVWIFFSAPVPAWKPRLLGSRVLLPEAGAEMGEDAAFDRFFPNQDRHSGKSLGNLIALPLQGERLKHGCTVFLDTFNELAPSPDQWEFLASIERVDEAKLDELLQEFDLSDKDISQTPREAAPPDDEILRRMAGGISEGNGRNEAAYTLLLRLAKKDVPRNEAIALATAWNQTNTPPLSVAELLRTAESAYQRERSKNHVAADPHVQDQQQHGRQYHRVGMADLRKSYTPTAWMIDQILPLGGIVVIASEPGKGKTWTALDASLGVATGKAWVDHFTCRQGRVLLILEEDAPNAIKERLDILYAGRGIPEAEGDALFIEYLIQQGVSLSDEGGLMALESQIREYQPEMLVVDTLRRCHAYEENDSGQMAKLFHLLRELTQIPDNPCSILVMHHLRKQSDHNKGLDRLRGSSDISAAADGILRIDGKFGAMFVKHEKSKRGPAVEPFCVKTEAGEGSMKLIYSDKEVKEEKAEEDQARCAAFVMRILTGGPLNKAQLYERGRSKDYGRSRIDRAIKMLEKGGRVRIELSGRENIVHLTHTENHVAADDMYMGPAATWSETDFEGKKPPEVTEPTPELETTVEAGGQL